MRVRISDEIVEIARKHQNENERVEIYGKAVMYAIEKIIIDERMAEYLDPNKRRSDKMKDNRNSVGHTVKQSGTDCLKKQSGTHCINRVGHTVGEQSRTKKKEISEESLTIYISNNIELYNIIHEYIFNNINTGNIQYLVETHGEQKYIYTQMLEAEKLIKKIGLDTLKTILTYIQQDDFRCNQILTITKLNRKNKDGVPYYVVIMDKIRQRKPKVISIPTV